MFEAAFNESLANEELKGGQKKLDVAPPYGKLTAADFKSFVVVRKKLVKKVMSLQVN